MIFVNIYIDLDGTILDISERYYKIYYDIVVSFSGKPLSKERYWELKRKKVSEEEILKLSDISDIYTCIKKRLERIESVEYLKHDTLLPGSLDTLITLKNKSNRLILVTLRKSMENLYKQLTCLGILHLFDKILVTNTNKDQWLIKSKLIVKGDEHFDKTNSVIVGDTEVDILAGKVLGIKTVSVLTGIRSRDILLANKPDYIINSIKELPNIICGFGGELDEDTSCKSQTAV